MPQWTVFVEFALGAIAIDRTERTVKLTVDAADVNAAYSTAIALLNQPIIVDAARSTESRIVAYPVSTMTKIEVVPAGESQVEKPIEPLKLPTKRSRRFL